MKEVVGDKGYHKAETIQTLEEVQHARSYIAAPKTLDTHFDPGVALCGGYQRPEAGGSAVDLEAADHDHPFPDPRRFRWIRRTPFASVTRK